ncbi:F-box domain-containing protein [Colletotrichum orchidophilum]|uniref:F-box domain-containing protein n=1 Tax=Colletotrichum orchidophilum TaxID=1209926 RepID=A0A1G4BQV6_9PEZI|nr:F-box domain-containing protein [Colletotrichum orchidophilum]OHF03667.1 F-box domain-containing protein [Colletotrichum orchidophilum]
MSGSQPLRAVETVLAIPELLEYILVQVDMRTLLVSASRVSKTWKAFIDGSPAVQQALFFKPVSMDVSRAVIHGLEDGVFPSIPSQSVMPTHTRGASLINPLLAEKFDKCFFDFGPTYSCQRRANSFYELPWSKTPNPIQTVQEYWGGWSQVKPPELDEEAARSQDETRRRFTRRGASWRRMLISQPPPPSLGYMRFDVCSLALEEQQVASSLIQPSPSSPGIHTPFNGVRMGELYDIVQHAVGHHGRHSLWFRVLWGKPTTHFAFSHAEDVFDKLMARTSVVVELMHADDTSLPNHPQDPSDVGMFDAAFRCEEHREVKFETEQTCGEAVEFPHFHPRYVVWHWKLMEVE